MGEVIKSCASQLLNIQTDFSAAKKKRIHECVDLTKQLQEKGCDVSEVKVDVNIFCGQT